MTRVAECPTANSMPANEVPRVIRTQVRDRGRGPRLPFVQSAGGDDLTVLAGTDTFEDGEPTGQGRSRLVRAGLVA